MPTLTAVRGLVTLPSELTRPDGALSAADNVVIDADNVVEPRRGFSEFGNENVGNAMAKQVMTYKGRILKHYASKIAFDSTGAGVFQEFSGSYAELVTKLRIKYFESNSNLYFTTAEGIKKISAVSAADFTTNSGFITDAGGIKAVGFQATLRPSAAGWLPAQSKVAYKVLWATKDANSNVIRGVPTSRVVISNTSQDVNVGENFTVAIVSYAGITDSEYFTFNSPTNSFAAYFDVTGSAAEPVGADLLGRQLIKVVIQGLTSNADVAAKLASDLSAITDISVSVDGTTVSITNLDSGDTLDASQGNLATADVLVSKVFDGQTSVGIPANISLNIPIPTQITSTVYFYELYRTAFQTVSPGVTLQDLDPGEEFQKVYEAPLTSADLTAGEVIVEDITPETFRDGGAFLYVNPVSGEGIAQANEAPPIAHDVALFKGSAFYANTKERHRLQFNLLSVSDFVSGTSKFYVGNSTSLCEYTFVGSAESVDFTVLPKSTTAGNSYIIINSARDALKYKVWFDKGIIQHSFDSTADVDDATETITIANHGYANNDKVTFSGTLPTGLTSGTDYYVINRTSNTFQVALTVAGPAVDLTDVVGTGVVVHTPVEPTVADSIALRVALQTYDDTLQGSVDAFKEAFFDITDFDPQDQGSGVVRVFWTDNGEVTDPSNSTPASGWTNSVITQGDGEDASIGQVFLSGLSSVGLSVEDTARSLERVINKDASCPVSAFYLSGLNDLPGILLLESKSLVDDNFYIGCNPSVISSKFNPELPASVTITDITSAGNIFTTSGAHGYVAGQEVYVHDNPGGTKVQFAGKYTIATTPASNTFTLTGVTVGINQTGISGIMYLAEVRSDNSKNANRVYFSKLYQPEAVPLPNFIDIGPKDKAIQRILALRDSLIVLKEDGVYLISGSSAPNFSVRLVDSSAVVVAPDTAANLNNLIYVLSSQGVVSVSETGVGVISRNIENKIQEIANARYDYKLTSWGMASESDRSYLLFLPTKTSDGVATQAYRYNTFTRAWTRWTKPANCGVVNPGDDKIYLGDASGRAYVLQERKNYERQDYSDRDFQRSIGESAISGSSIIISSVADVEVGDSFVQFQYLDINKFNRFLKKLDMDQLLSSNYYSLLNVTAGDSLAAALTALSVKLNADNILAPSTSNSDLTDDIRDDFNAIIDYLNNPGSGTGLKDYKRADDLLVYEVPIVGVSLPTNTVTLKYSQKFIQGVATVYKGIKCLVQYAPQHFGKPEATKQIAEGTFIFDQNNFWGGTVGYSSDRSADFSSTDFSLKGPGFWDAYNWANATWGGEGNEVPVRTLVPRDKARCRYLHVQFYHVNAREVFKLLGVSLEPREVSVRGYR
jgi:hypothetical protein